LGLEASRESPGTEKSCRTREKNFPITGKTIAKKKKKPKAWQKKKKVPLRKKPRGKYNSEKNTRGPG